jgi:uncharacterized protein YecT (DUF1311 family)
MVRLPKAVFVAGLLVAAAASAGSPRSIRGVDFKRYLLHTAFGGCAEQVKELCVGRKDTPCCPSGLDVSVSYADLSGTGEELAIVQGSSCQAGTGGPDIHAVYALGRDGTPQELPLPPVAPGVFDGLFGNRNSVLSAEGRTLVERYTDTSDRPAPLVLRYVLEHGVLTVSRAEKAPVYPTSYDCQAARSEQARAICHVAPLAALDLRLAAALEARRRAATPEARARLDETQAAWLARRDAECTVSKWWVECLTEAYEARLRALGTPK